VLSLVSWLQLDGQVLRGTVMKKLAIAMIGLFGLIGTPALAADMALKMPPAPGAGWDWTGTYGGIVGGGGWASTIQTDTAGTTTGNYTQSGGTFGGTTGLQIQYKHWVFGEESDLSWANINGSVPSALCAAGTCFTNLQWFGTSRARLGYAWDRYMIYGTGGVAYGSIKAGQDGCTGALTVCGTNTEVGWTAGAGIEAFITPMWSVKVEYLHIDLGRSFSYAPVIPVFVTERADLVRAGINLHLNLFNLLPLANM
jgi:outer membrane immunogenic protein